VRATDIAVRAEGAATQVVVTFSAPSPTPLAWRANAIAWWSMCPTPCSKGAPHAITRPVGVVAGVLAQSFSQGSSSTARFWITMSRSTTHTLRVEDTRLVVTLGGSNHGRELPSPLPLAAPRPDREQGRVLDVRFDHRSARDRLMIKLSTAVTYRQSSRGPGKTLVVLESCRLPDELRRPWT